MCYVLLLRYIRILNNPKKLVHIIDSSRARSNRCLHARDIFEARESWNPMKDAIFKLG